MNKKYILFLFFINLNLQAEGFEAKNLLLSGMPNWLEALNYCFLLSENYGNKTFGHSNYNQEKFIRDILTKNNYQNSKEINIKRISDNKQKYVKAAALGIANTIYINSKYYRGLNDDEREAVITRVMIQISNNQIKKNIGALITIPFLTHGLVFLAKESFKIFKNSFVILKQQSAFSEQSPAQSSTSTNNTGTPDNKKYIKSIINSNPFEITVASVLNIIFTNLYFKNKAKSLDIKTVLKTKNIGALVSYYTKMHNNKDAQENSFLLSLRQPSIEQRLKYLSKIKI